jgi:hypothetical protein
MREAFDRLSADLRGEIRSSASETRVYVGERIETTRVYVDERFEAHTTSLIHELRESESRTRRYFDVAGESLRGDIRGVAELVALSNEESRCRDDEQSGRTDGIENRVLRLEVRVRSLEDDRKPRRPRRRR